MKSSKIAVSMPSKLVSRIRRAVARGQARSVSAYVTQAVSVRAEGDDLLELLKELDREHGKPGPEATRWARQVLGL